jgi:hypothetical protein
LKTTKTPAGNVGPRSEPRNKVIRAVKRARLSIITIAAAYAVSALVGGIMVHGQNRFALAYRDKIVGAASKGAIVQASNAGDEIRAALWDATGNLCLSTLPKAIAGMSVVLPYPWVMYQGWIGGIVSVRGDHTSRLNNWRSATYYLVTMLLQIAAFSLGVGAGVNVGVSMFRPAPYYEGVKWAGLFPKESIIDAVRIFVIVIPLCYIGSFWEFLSPWNI